MPLDVFIAFTSHDAPEARALRDQLREEGVDAWMCDEVGPGLWDEQVRVKQEEANWTVALLSRSSRDGLHWRDEVLRAVDRKNLIVVMVDEWARTNPDQWPSGTRGFQARSIHDGAAAWIAHHIRNGAKSVALDARPARDVVARIVAALEITVENPKHRKTVLKLAGLPHDASYGWRAITESLSTAQLQDLIRAADLEDATSLLEALAVPPAPTDWEAVATALVDHDIDRAMDALRRERYDEAAAEFTKILDLAGTASRAIQHRARLHRANALFCLGRDDDARKDLEAVDPNHIGERGRINLARFLLADGQVGRAEELLPALAGPGAETVRQLAELRAGRMPDSLSEDASVQVSAGGLAMNQLRLGAAVQHALSALAAGTLNEHGRCAVARLLAESLNGWWIGMSADRVAEPGAALARLRELCTAAGQVADWERPRRMLRVCDLEHDDADVEADLADPTTRRVRPPWAEAFDAAVTADDPLAALLPLARDYPAAGPVRLSLAGLLSHHDHHDAAVEHAVAALEILPGRGQRSQWLHILAAAGRWTEVEAALGPNFERTPANHELRVLALRGRRTEAIEAAVEWATDWPGDPDAWVYEAQLHLQGGEVEEARHCAREALRPGVALSLGAYEVLAQAVWVPSAPPDEALVGELDRAIHAALPGDPKADALRFRLLQGARAARTATVDADLLVQSGQFWRVEPDELFAQSRTRARLARMIDRAARLGGLCFEEWAKRHGMTPGAIAMDVRDGTFHWLPPVVDPATPVGWRGQSCLVGALALELLAATDCLDPFFAAAGAVVVLEDVFLRYANALVNPQVAAWRREIEGLDSTWAELGDLPRFISTELVPDDLSGLRAWLEGTPGGWGPPASTVALTWATIHALHDAGLLPRFIEYCGRRGVALGIDRTAQETRDLRRRVINRAIEAAQTGEHIARSLLRAREAGRLDVVPLPDGPKLPPGPATAPDLLRAFAAREVLASRRELILVSAELAEFGLGGFGPAFLCAGHRWDTDVGGALRERHEAVAPRVVAIAAVIRDLSPSESSLTRLATAGHVAALDGTLVVALARKLGGPDRSTARDAFLGLVGWTGEDRLLEGGFLGVEVARALSTDAWTELWVGDKLQSDGADVLLALLTTTEEMDRVAKCRLRISESVIRQLAVLSLTRWSSFLVSLPDEMAALDTGGPVGQLWARIGAWARSPTDPGAALRRRTALDLGVAGAVPFFPTLREVGATPRAREVYASIGVGILTAIVSHLPAPVGVRLDLATHAAVYRIPDAAGVHDALTLPGTDGAPRSLAEWRRLALLTKRATLVGIDLRYQTAEGTVVLPLEAVVFGLEPAGLAQIASSVTAHDAALGGALRAHAERQDPESVAKVRMALERSPLRALRQDPSVVWSWSRGRLAGPGTLSTPVELSELLGEPVSADPMTAEELTDRLAPGGPWEDVDRWEITRQLERIPGQTLGFGAGLLLQSGELGDDDLRRLVTIADRVDDFSVGTVASAVISLSSSARLRPVRTLGDREVDLVALSTSIAVSGLAPRAGGDDIAALPVSKRLAQYEPALVRGCMAVVADLAEGLPLPRATWWAWRLHGWLLSQLDFLRDSRQPRELRQAVLELLAGTAPPPADPSEPLGMEAFDPRRLGPGRIDLRELGLLEALAHVSSAAGAIDWAALTPTLVAITMRSLTPDELAIRDRWTACSLGSEKLVAPDLARTLLLQNDLRIIDTFTAEQRYRWLADALAAPPVVDGLTRRAVADHVLSAFVLSTWTEFERERIAAAMEVMAVDSPARASFLISAWGRVDPALGERAWTAFRASAELGAHLAPEWWLAAARRGELDAAVEKTRAHLRALGVDEAPFLVVLGRPLSIPETGPRSQAERVVRRLAAEPGLASALSPLLRYLDGADA